MSEPSAPPPDALPSKKPKDKGPGKGEVVALGIGCLVFLIFIAAIITVGVMRE